jgi:hypothetical protein
VEYSSILDQCVAVRILEVSRRVIERYSSDSRETGTGACEIPWIVLKSAMCMDSPKCILTQDRVKTFIKKIKDTEELAKGPTLKLDKEASKRLVNNALSGDQVYAQALDARTKTEEKTEAESTLSKKTPVDKRATASASSADKKSKKRRKN